MLHNKKVLLTGANGFLAKHLLPLLIAEGAEVVATSLNKSDVVSTQANLTYSEDAEHLFIEADRSGKMYDYVIHLAAFNGGIAFNKLCPAKVFSDNTMMALNLLRCCRQYRVSKVLMTLSGCGYPDTVECNNDMCESNYLQHAPEPTNASHGYAKRNILLGCRYYKEEFNLNAITVCLDTLYGPYDRLDPGRTKFVTALVKKFVDAKRENLPSVTCWGTGKPRREIIYAGDAAKYIILALLLYNDSSIPLNIGAGTEVSVKELAEKVAKVVKYEGEILWDVSRADGQLRRHLNRSRQLAILGEIPVTPLDEGLQMTIDWYRSIPCLS